MILASKENIENIENTQVENEQTVKKKKGHIIVIDGTDGCGKETQAKILKAELEKLGHTVYMTSFPNYDSLSSGPVRMYLSGQIGDNAEALNPYACGLMYSIDRYITYMTDIKKHYENCEIIILDRYISANIVYQGAKIRDKQSLLDYFKFAYEVETDKMGLPNEDITIFLTLPIDITEKLMSNRYNNDESKKDIHESNTVYLNKCLNIIDLACEYFTEQGLNWIKLDCSNKEKNWIQSKDEIAKYILSIISENTDIQIN